MIEYIVVHRIRSDLGELFHEETITGEPPLDTADREHLATLEVPKIGSMVRTLTAHPRFGVYMGFVRQAEDALGAGDYSSAIEALHGLYVALGD